MTALQDLLVVQQLDTAADQVRHRRSHHPARADLAAATADLAALQRDLDAAEAVRAGIADRQAALEREVAGLQAKRGQVARKLATGTVPKELQALSDEADSLARHQSALEDQVLACMEEAEPVEERLAALAERRTAVDDRAAAARVTLAEVEAACDAELADLAARRVVALTTVAPALLTRYESMRPKLGGVAVASLVQGRCTGCNLQVPASELEDLRAQPADALVVCEQCGRLLVR